MPRTVTSRRLWIIATVTALGLPPLVAADASAAAITTRRGPVHIAASDRETAIAKTRIGQTGNRLQWSVTLVRPRAELDLDRSRGGGICAVFTAPEGPGPLCVARSHRKWFATFGGQEVTAPVELVGRRSIRVTVPLADLHLPAGPLSWAVSFREAACALGNSTCSDRLPVHGHLHDQLWRPVAVGCKRTGSGQVTRGPSSRREIALTFDDGPSPFTPEIRAILEREGAVATFFELGRSLAGQGAVARGLLGDGDELGDHSWDHANLGGGGPAATSEIVRTGSAIRAATGFTPCTFRPPYGATGADLVGRANAQGMTSVLWTIDTDDWQLPGAATIEQRVLDGVVPGAIVLMHDGGGPRGESVAALAAVLPVLRSRGYQFVTVSQLLGNATTYGLEPVRQPAR